MSSELIFLFYLICGTIAAPYANNFPYKKFAFDNADAEGDSDSGGYLKNQLSDHGNNLNAAADVGNFYSIDNNLNAHELQNTKKGVSSDTLKHLAGENFENDKSHNRKNIKSGFSNSYHKDENGSKTSYYEDSDDHGGKKVYDKRDGMRGDDYVSNLDEGYKNGAVRDKYDDRRGGHDTRGLRDHQHSLAEDQGNRHGYRDGYRAGEGTYLETINHPYDNRDNYDYRYRQPPPLPLSGNFRQLPPLPPQNYRPHHELNYSQRPKITIFEDPREFIDPRNDRSSWLRRRNDFVTNNREYRSPVLRFTGARSRDSDRDLYNRYRDY